MILNTNFDTTINYESISTLTLLLHHSHKSEREPSSNKYLKQTNMDIVCDARYDVVKLITETFTLNS